MEQAHALAESLGARIVYADLTHLGRDGDCNPDTRVIRLQRGMLPRLERCVLTHECAHLIRGDRRTMFGFYNDRDERHADEWAAEQLIDLTEYQIAEAKCGNNIEAIAQELNVMAFIIEAYERTLQRIGNTTYMRPRMGIGCWQERYEYAS